MEIWIVLTDNDAEYSLNGPERRSGVILNGAFYHEKKAHDLASKLERERQKALPSSASWTERCDRTLVAKMIVK